MPCYASYREFRFSANSADILSTQKPMFAEMAEHRKRNLSLTVAIAGRQDRPMMFQQNLLAARRAPGSQ